MTYKTTIFTSIGNLVNDIITYISKADISTQVDQINTLILVWFTLYVIAKGYMILAGKSDEPVKDLLWRLSLYAIIVTFATNAGGWLTYISNAIDGLNDWAGFGDSLYAQLDKVFAKAIEMGVMVEDQEKQTLDVVNMAGILANAIILIGFGFFAIPAIGIIIVTSFTLKLLILIAPIMIFTLLFPWFKSIFEKWIQLIISNTLTVFFVGLSFKVLTNVYNDYIAFAASQAKAIGENGLALSVEIFFVSIILMLLILMSRNIAKELTYVSIESLPGSAAKSAGNGLNSIRRGGENARADLGKSRNRWRRK